MAKILCDTERENLTLAFDRETDIDIDALNLIASGASGFCRCTYENRGGDHVLIYDTKISPSLNRFDRGIDYDAAVGVLAGAVDALETVSGNELFIGNIIIGKGYVFKTDEGYKFIYAPFYGKQSLSVRAFLLELLRIIRCKNPELGRLKKAIKRSGNDAAAFECLRAFTETHTIKAFAGASLDDEPDTSLLAPQEAEVSQWVPSGFGGFRQEPFGEKLDYGNTAFKQSGVSNFCDAEPDTSLLSSEEPDFPQQAFAGIPDTAPAPFVPVASDWGVDEQETTLLSEDGAGAAPMAMEPFFTGQEDETTVLNAVGGCPNVRRGGTELLLLKRELNGEVIAVRTTPFVFGRDSSVVNGVLSNPSVSRSHATVIFEAGKYYITDNGSTNGTAVEGIGLQPNEKREIDNGDIISMGEETLQVYIERGER